MKRRRLLVQGVAILVPAAVIVAVGLLYYRPLPALAAETTAPATTPAVTPAPLPWPAFGQSAVGVEGYGALATSGGQHPSPTASVAKLMTALVVLDKKPLVSGQTGPLLTVTAADLAVYDRYFAQGGSLVRVQAGETISQYDVLEALLLPSANNMADMLATWAFGSVDAYAAYANTFAKAHGLSQTTISDASGFSPATVSTADDLVRLGSLALGNPVIAEIVAKRTADIPVAGTIYNVNGLLGKAGINGLKTGNTTEAGGVFLVSADRTLPDGHNITAIVAVMGGPDLESAMRASLPLLDAATAGSSFTTAIKKGQSFGSYAATWNNTGGNRTAQAIASRDVTAFSWQGAKPTITTKLAPLNGPQASGTTAGSVSVTANGKTERIPLALSKPIDAPSAWWRINR